MSPTSRLIPVNEISDRQDPRVRMILDFPDYYITSDGQVYSSKNRKWRPLSAQIDGGGYKFYRLCIEGEIFMKKEHILVAETYIGRRPHGMFCCHNDGNSLNNDYRNLRWDTPSANALDMQIHGTENPPRGTMNGMSKLSESDVIQIRTEYARGDTTHHAIADKFGVSREQIRDIVNRKYWQHV